jgi:hypothetical protein
MNVIGFIVVFVQTHLKITQLDFVCATEVKRVKYSKALLAGNHHDGSPPVAPSEKRH